jgi:hypothetical protein
MNEQLLSEFWRECNIRSKLRPHVNIVQFLGVCLNPLCVVTEFLPNGRRKKKFFFLSSFLFFNWIIFHFLFRMKAICGVIFPIKTIKLMMIWFWNGSKVYNNVISTTFLIKNFQFMSKRNFKWNASPFFWRNCSQRFGCKKCVVKVNKLKKKTATAQCIQQYFKSNHLPKKLQ